MQKRLSSVNAILFQIPTTIPKDMSRQQLTTFSLLPIKLPVIFLIS